MHNFAENQPVQIANAQRARERNDDVDAEDFPAPGLPSLFDPGKVPHAQPSFALDLGLRPAVGLANRLEAARDLSAQVLHFDTLATDNCQQKLVDCSVASICKSCGEKAAFTACVYALTREGRRTVCGRVLCEDCKVLVPGVGCYCRAHAIVTRSTR